MPDPEKRQPGKPLSNSPEAIEYTAYLRANHKAIEKQYGLPDGLLFALSSHESGLDPLAISGTGAVGAFQFIPITARSFGLTVNDEVDDRLDYKKSIHAAAKYLSVNMKKFGNIAHALADYNGGGKAVDHLKAGKHPDDFLSKNGNYELGQFLSRIGQHGIKNGFQSIDDGIQEFGYKNKTKGKANLPKTENKSDKLIESDNKISHFVKDQRANSSNNYLEKKDIVSLDEKQAVAVISPTLFSNQFQRRQVLSGYSQTEAPIKTVSVFNKPVSSDQNSSQSKKSFLEMAPDLFQVFKNGGKIVQLSGDGKTIEATLKGKERIYSRRDTNRLMQLAKKAKSLDDYFILGKFLYDATKKQDSRPTEYVDA